ncbi:MAG TPA: hypothetical protein VKL21_03750 [Candidatus Methanoperedens sp.]|nr:hypothetical protein [Candidatus Methanoperedens sp.]
MIFKLLFPNFTQTRAPLPLAAGVDLKAIDGVTVNIMELNVPGNREGTIYFDYLKGSY